MAKLIELKSHIDPRGSLTVIEKELPLPVKRAYFIYDVPADSIRGGHAHKQTIQVLICVSGGCIVECQTQGQAKVEFHLDAPSKALVLDPPDFHYMKDFKPGTVLLVLSSHAYDPNDYVHESKL